MILSHRIVCSVVRPLVLPVGAAHQGPLEVMDIGGATVVEVPAACLTGAGARSSSELFFHFVKFSSHYYISWSHL